MAKANVELSSFLINFTKMFHNQLCGQVGGMKPSFAMSCTSFSYVLLRLTKPNNLDRPAPEKEMERVDNMSQEERRKNWEKLEREYNEICKEIEICI